MFWLFVTTTLHHSKIHKYIKRQRLCDVAFFVALSLLQACPCEFSRSPFNVTHAPPLIGALTPRFIHQQPRHYTVPIRVSTEHRLPEFPCHD